MEHLPCKARLHNLGPLSWEDMRLTVEITTAYRGGERGKKKKRKRKSKSMQHHHSSNPASMSSRRHLRKLLEISFKPVRVPLFTAGSELPEVPAREGCGGRDHQQVQRQLSDSQRVDKER